MKIFHLELNVQDAASESAVVNALQRAAKLIEEGNIEGDLRTAEIEFGHFTLSITEADDEPDPQPPQE